jgi:P-type conjugative transfer protein TrbJ
MNPNIHPGARIALISTALASSVAHAQGIPVIDVGNLSQNVMTAMESVAQTLKQIQQHKTQLQQYENQLQNSTAPPAYLWDKTQATINALIIANDLLQQHKSRLGSLENYLNRFQDVSYYRSSPCFSATGCSAAQWAELQQNKAFAASSQKRANDAIFRGLDIQQQNLSSDAQNLERLQSTAQTATGQMQAIGYANQLASQQTNQLLQIRALLVAQQGAVTTRMQAQADQEAQQAAAKETYRRSSFKPSTNQRW